MAIGRQELRKALGDKPFITKGELKDCMGYKKHAQVQKFFYGLPHLGSKYYTEDVISRMLGEIEYDED